MNAKDLSRWNRAGLKRFRYVDGNAVRFLEDLRLALRRAYRDSDGVLQWPDLDSAVPVKVNETVHQRQQRWLAQYRDQRRDYLWEITRSHARALHILAEYLDAYANESYLGTASQWDNVRKLVAMLDYQPAPPASATMPLALLAKPGEKGQIKAGLACKNQPAPGAPTIIFETLEDLTVDAALNTLRGRDWNRSFQPLQIERRHDNTGSRDWLSYPLAEVPVGVAVGSRGILLQENGVGGGRGWSVTVAAIDDNGLLLVTGAGVVVRRDLRRWQARLLLKPRRREKPLLSGDNAVRLQAAHSLAAGDVVAWQLGSAWQVAQISAADGLRLRFSGGQIPGAGAKLYRVLQARRQQLPDGSSKIVLPLAKDRESGALWNTQQQVIIQSQVKTQQHGQGASAQDIFDYVDANDAEALYYLPNLQDPAAPNSVAATVQAARPQSLALAGDPGSISAGQWLLSETQNRWQAVQVTGLDVGEDDFSLQLSATLAEVNALHYDFAQQLRPLDHARNQMPLSTPEAAQRQAQMQNVQALTTFGQLAPSRSSARQATPERLTQEAFKQASQANKVAVSATQLASQLQLRPASDVGSQSTPGQSTSNIPSGTSHIQLADPLHPLLQRGRRLIISGPKRVQAVTIREVRAAEGVIIVEPALPVAANGEAEPYPRDASLIYANVALAGHGDTLAESVLGSGDASHTGQRFELPASAVSFSADPAFPSGVRAAVRVTVDGHIWQQQANLAEAQAEDAVYQVHLLEDGSLRFVFGDGWHGRRLPTGVNNVRVVQRQGHGVAGNLPPGSVEKLLRPSPIAENVHQLLAASGGNDLESVSSLRQNAPATLLSMQRAVSLSDFSHLASAHSGVWQARAGRRQPGIGQGERIDLVVVPAGGGPLGQLGSELAATLQARALPAVRITVRRYQPVLLEARLTVQVRRAEYEPEEVIDALRESLAARFSLRQQTLGAPFFRSQLVQAVEAVAGVENARVEINPWGFVDDQAAAVNPARVVRGQRESQGQNDGSNDGSDPIRRVSPSADQLFYLDPRQSRLEILTREFVL